MFASVVWDALNITSAKATFAGLNLSTAAVGVELVVGVGGSTLYLNMSHKDDQWAAVASVTLDLFADPTTVALGGTYDEATGVDMYGTITDLPGKHDSARAKQMPVGDIDSLVIVCTSVDLRRSCVHARRLYLGL